MAYHAVAQTEHEELSDTDGLHWTASKRDDQVQYSFRPLSLDFESLPASESLQLGENYEQSNTRHLKSSMISLSSSGTSYDMLSENDSRRSEGNQKNQESPSTRQAKLEYESGTGNTETVTTARQGPILDSDPSFSQPVMRIVSREDTGPLRHPIPDLQSVQDSYIPNVARLEQSAERLSMGTDIRDRVRSINFDPGYGGSRPSSGVGSPTERRFSSGSTSNYLAGAHDTVKSGGQFPSSHLSSPRGSTYSNSNSHLSNRVRSASRGSQLAQTWEPNQGGRSPNRQISGPLGPGSTQTSSSNHQWTARNVGTNTNAESSQPKQLSRTPPVDDRRETDLDIGKHMSDELGIGISGDTPRQVSDLFVDFDGVHFDHHGKEISPAGVVTSGNRRVSLHRPPSTGRPLSYAELLPGENMVYYPAPVPIMLNLPRRLSKIPSATEREKRRSQVLSGVMVEARKSASWLPGVLEDGQAEGVDASEQSPARRKSIGFRRSTNDLAKIAPHLRASAFFDQPSTSLEVEVKEDSAVATLESILDASAHAPVSAFVDHPIAGRVGAEVYGKRSSRTRMGDAISNRAEARKGRNSLNLLDDSLTGMDSHHAGKKASSITTHEGQSDRRKSTGLQTEEVEADAAAFSVEATPLRLSYELGTYAKDETSHEEHDEHPDTEEIMNVEKEAFAQEEEEADEEDAEYAGRPTTLLAELQLRKQQQKLRNRTAATAFPNGMHSTLLQLDAVAQVQKQSRKQKHIKLAWEDPDAQFPGTENQDDEDIPLAMLFPGRRAQANEQTGQSGDHQPLGLIEKRAMEDNEPLSHRRARLRGGLPTSRSCSPARRAGTPYTLEVPGLTDSKGAQDIDEEGESLAQRMRRLKAHGKSITGLQDRPVSGDFTSEVMKQFGVSETVEKQVKNHAVETEEETLGQRRKRLHAEQEARSRQLSGGTKPTASPARPPLKTRRSMADILQVHPAAGGRQASEDRGPLATMQNGAGNGAIRLPVYHNQYTQPQPHQHFVEQKMPSTSAAFAVPNTDTDQRRPQFAARSRTISGNPYNVIGPGGMAAGIGIPAYNSSYIGPAQIGTGMKGYQGLLNYSNVIGYEHHPVPTNGIGCTLPYGGGVVQAGMSPLQIGQMPIALDPKQRDMIDRWRQSVMH